jgi:hypothetical protein
MNNLPWRPIEELYVDGEYNHALGDSEAGILLLAPELVDLDCNVHGVGMGYYQDGPLFLSSMPAGTREYKEGSWLACKWSMSYDEWYEVPCKPTHYIRLTGAGT